MDADRNVCLFAWLRGRCNVHFVQLAMKLNWNYSSHLNVKYESYEFMRLTNDHSAALSINFLQKFNRIVDLIPYVLAGPIHVRRQQSTSLYTKRQLFVFFVVAFIICLIWTQSTMCNWNWIDIWSSIHPHYILFMVKCVIVWSVLLLIEWRIIKQQRRQRLRMIHQLNLWQKPNNIHHNINDDKPAR